ncbi:MAG: alanine--glyoxylate aminotransferase family protein, partial [Anaerolineae bacterium]|nr:alanine--glyoxylate aminotransferase family protein [Anaerolineae bacterium]
GTAGMEAAMYNVVEPGDRVLVCVNGYFGERMCDMAQRCGGELIRLDTEWGHAVDPAQVEQALKTGEVKVVFVVHAETSTGVMQPLEEISRLAHEHGALMMVDTVTSLGGCPVKVDEWELDVVYSGTQKCVGCPPGLAPITFSPRAEKVLDARKTRIQSFYLDMTLVRKYWGQERFYHHTAPISMCYALREALRLLYEEGLEARWERHALNSRALMAGLQAMGLQPFAQEGYRLAQLNAVRVPEGVVDGKVRGRLLEEYSIEIGGGLGVLKGKIWRIGLMGYNSTARTVYVFLSALESVLQAEGFSLTAGEAMAAAREVYG